MTAVPPAQGVRQHWADLPEPVRADIASRVGGRVVAAHTHPGGFSPGLAATLTLDDGKRVFVKAVSASANADSPPMHRAEAAITSALPAGVPVPQLLAVHDDGDWVALAYEHIDGRHPLLPWQQDELEHVMSCLVRLHEALTPPPVSALRAVDDPDLAEEFCGWRWLRTNGGTGLDPWARAHLDDLIALEEQWRTYAGGDTLLHLDLRADNMIVRPNGDVVFVDWPAALVGSPLLEVVIMAPAVGMQGGPDLDWLLARHPATVTADRVAVAVLLAAFAGYLVHRSLQPAPPALPTLRPFQAAQGRVALRWLQDRLESPSRPGRYRDL